MFLLLRNGRPISICYFKLCILIYLHWSSLSISSFAVYPSTQPFWLLFMWSTTLTELFQNLCWTVIETLSLFMKSVKIEIWPEHHLIHLCLQAACKQPLLNYYTEGCHWYGIYVHQYTNIEIQRNNIHIHTVYK